MTCSLLNHTSFAERATLCTNEHQEKKHFAQHPAACCTHDQCSPNLSRCRLLSQKWEIFFTDPEVKVNVDTVLVGYPAIQQDSASAHLACDTVQLVQCECPHFISFPLSCGCSNSSHDSDVNASRESTAQKNSTATGRSGKAIKSQDATLCFLCFVSFRFAFYRQDARCLDYSMDDFWVSRPQRPTGATQCTDGAKSGVEESIKIDFFTPSVQGWGVGPQKLRNTTFRNINACPLHHFVQYFQDLCAVPYSVND